MLKGQVQLNGRLFIRFHCMRPIILSSATASEDYRRGSSIITFNSRVQNVTMEIPILEDTIFEMTEEFSIEIRHPFPEDVDPGLEIVTPSTLVLIVDNDSKFPNHSYLYLLI